MLPIDKEKIKYKKYKSKYIKELNKLSNLTKKDSSDLIIESKTDNINLNQKGGDINDTLKDIYNYKLNKLRVSIDTLNMSKLLIDLEILIMDNVKAVL